MSVQKQLFGEGTHVEFKERIPDRHERFLKDIIAFENTSGGKEQSSYIRINGTRRPADTRKLKELELEGQKISYDTMQAIGVPYDEAEVRNLMNSMYRTAYDACRSEEERAEVHPLTIAKMEDFGLLIRNGRDLAPTNGFVLMTNPKRRAARIQCAVFKGKGREEFIDRKEFQDAIQNQVEEAYQFVLRHMSGGRQVGPGLNNLQQAEDIIFVLLQIVLIDMLSFGFLVAQIQPGKHRKRNQIDRVKYRDIVNDPAALHHETVVFVIQKDGRQAGDAVIDVNRDNSGFELQAVVRVSGEQFNLHRIAGFRFGEAVVMDIAAVFPSAAVFTSPDIVPENFREFLSPGLQYQNHIDVFCRTERQIFFRHQNIAGGSSDNGIAVRILFKLITK